MIDSTRPPFLGSPNSAWFSLVAICVFCILPGGAGAEDDRLNWGTVRPLVAKFCFDCHGEDAAMGRLRLDRLAPEFATKEQTDHWLKVLEKLRTGEMPPEKRPRPPQADIDRVASWIDREIVAADDLRQRTEGRVVLRRLNRVEYENTINDLLGIDARLMDLLPEDDTVGGFDNNARAQRLSAVHLERYLETAELALDDAISNDRDPPEKFQKTFRYRLNALDNDGKIKESWALTKADFDVFFMGGSIFYSLYELHVPRAGRYRVRISAFAYQSEQPVTMRLCVGDVYQLNGAGPTGGATHHLVGYYDVPPGKPTVIEFVDWFYPGDTIRIDPYNCLRPSNYADASKYKNGKIVITDYLGAGLAVGDIDVEGPLIEKWPPVSHQRLLGSLPQVAVPGGKTRPRYRRDEPRPLFVVTSEEPAKDAERILRDFLPRAFRRPATDAEVAHFVQIVQARFDQERPFEEALRVGLKAVLCSSNFLFLKEKPGRLDAFALATRLSYFLWSSMPDQELTDLAGKGTLGEPEVLRRQVERMLRDPKARRFTENFVGQWLCLREIGETMPDPMLYPEFDELLKVSSVRETELFFDEVLKNDLSLLNFVDSNWSLLNERLAWHYRIPDIKGNDFRKVNLPADSGRGGVLTMASVLKVTANGTATSPVLRGAWVLKNILGQPAPPPPPGVPVLEPDIRGAVTIREQLAKHRQIASCASCHNKIDPPGFALEVFDPIGGPRDRYRHAFYGSSKGEPVHFTVAEGWKIRYRNGLPVDAKDVMSNGKPFHDVAEFKRLLLEDKNQIARCLTEKLLVYSTGGSIRPADRASIEEIVARLPSKNYGLRTLVHEVVQSRIFLNK